MAKAKILVIEDEKDILDIIEFNLEKEGYKVKCVDSGEEGLKQAREKIPDIIILDLMLPGIDGLDVCKILKNDSKTRHIPVIILTAKSEEADIVTGLEIGADDYITKPFSPRVLLARVKAVIRKLSMSSNDSDVIKKKDLIIDKGRREVLYKGKKVDLTFTEFELLYLLSKRSGWVFTRNQIVQAIKGNGYPVTERAVDVQIVGLRKKLGDAGEMIETIRGVGYRFRD
ncbi:MAG TPA: response regulator transcription factor [Victivallales bacterium]|nr:response regulator transcription factor [Victivallales bacterium]